MPPIHRRSVLRAGAAFAAAAPFARLGQTAAAGWPSLKGTKLNVIIIQPHVVSGRVLAEAFEQATGAKVELTVVPYDQLGSKATLDVQSGAGTIDVVEYWYVDVGSLAQNGVLVDVTEKLKDPEIDAADFAPSIFDPYTLAGGKRWGVPYDGDSHVLFVNTEILGRHGLKVPETWDDYLHVTRAVTEAEGKSGVFGAALLGFNVPIIIGCTYANRLAGFGGHFLKPDGTPDLLSDASQAAVKAILDAAPYALPTPLETAFEQGLPAFLSGKVAQIEFWTDLGVYAQDPKQSKVVDKWTAVPVPVGGANKQRVAPLDAGFAFGVSTASKNQDAAWQFVKFATGKEIHTKLITTVSSGIDPTRKSALAAGAPYTAFAPKLVGAATAAQPATLAWPTVPQAPALLQALSDELAKILAKTKSAEQGLKDAQATWTRLLGA